MIICGKCGSANAYEYAGVCSCPDCGEEWSKDGIVAEDQAGAAICDMNGVALQDGDTVVVMKDLKIKGSSSVVKIGTKVKNIRLVDGDHNIDCKIPGIGAMGLKSEFVKKAAD